MKKLMIGILAFSAFVSSAETLYVSPSGNDQNTGTVANQPLATIEAAISLLDESGGTIYLASGTYTLTGPVLRDDMSAVASNSNYFITSPIVIEGATGNAADVIVTRGTQGYYRPFYLNHADATLRFITVKNGYTTNQETQGAGVRIGPNGGQIDRCVITGNIENGGSGEPGGGGIAMEAGLVTKCIIENNKTSNMRRYGSGIYATGGRVEQCIIRKNDSAHHASSCNGNAAVALKGTAVMLNSVVTSNKSCLVSGIWVDSSSTCSAINCVAYGNIMCTSAHTDGATSVSGLFCAQLGVNTIFPANKLNRSSSPFFNCAAENGDVFSSSGCMALTESPFSNNAANQYSIAETSPLTDAGITNDASNQLYFPANATDCYGNERISGTTIDIGIHEFQRGNGLYIACVTASSEILTIPDDPAVTFTVESSGAVGDLSFVWNFGDGHDPVTTNTASITYTYADCGSFTVTVTAIDSEGPVVYSYPNPIQVSRLKCDYAVDKPRAKTGTDVTFSTTILVGDTVSFTWDFGDGTPTVKTTGLSVSHAYTTAGRYTVTVVADGGVDGVVTKILPDTINVVAPDLYVSTSGSGEFPYATQATAAKSPVTAIEAAADGCTIHVLPGTYITKDIQLCITNAVNVVGEGEKPNDTIFHNGYANFNNGQRNLYVNHPDARVSNVTLLGGRADYMSGGNLYLAAGAVSNCVLSSGGSSSSGGSGGAAYVSGGVLTHCVITNSYLGNRGNGITVCQAGGRVSNCLLTHNRKAWSGSRNAFSLYYATGGVVDNCTIKDCWILKYNPNNVLQMGGKSDTGFNVASGAKAYNLVIANLHYDFLPGASEENPEALIAAAYAEMPQRWTGTAASFVDCATDDAAAINATCRVGTLEANSLFEDYSNGNFAPGAVTKNKGTEIAGYAFPSVDLVGNSRVIGRAIDLGCYESTFIPGTKIILR